MKNELLTDIKLTLLEDYNNYIDVHRKTQHEINQLEHYKSLAVKKGNDGDALDFTKQLLQKCKEFAYQSGILGGLYSAVQTINHYMKGSDEK